MNRTATLLAVLAVAGCAQRFMWVKAGASQADFEQDAARCQYEAAAATATYGSSAPVPYSTSAAFGQGIGLGIGRALESSNLQVLCMRAKGYQQVQAGTQPSIGGTIDPALAPAFRPPDRPAPPAAAVGGLRAESKYLLQAEALAKAEGCVPPSLTMTAKGAGEESFVAGCPNGSTVTIACDVSGCRRLR